MAELHVVGEILGASGFPSPKLSCKWSLIAGEGWKVIEGVTSGQTHVDLPTDDRYTIWSHPIDIHYGTKTLVGWPKLQLQVYHQDEYGRNELYGYGFIHLPTTPGTHELECPTWRPLGSTSDQLWSYFLGATPQLKKLDHIHSPMDRYRLNTISMGKVHVEVTVIVRNFDAYGVAL
ncbi:B9 domain-containing protein 2-like protein [Polychytrium aggregatum]|uniref:B9 domain-containing protein 2-like protein n=1 Tax=Polychytrium aggregatum TaxID=110093 RepID=UPI0022FE3437|nr:B9 domain-containing protein 2-like protein [Polychytrium aggregatum]KAI9203705.1 B9 domain-containing protein 2-like protein [Polychytrium aggregatum]